MKKKFFILSGIVMAVIASLAITYFANQKSLQDAFFEANVEALSDDEIIVGPLCMEAPDRLCYSLGEYYENHQRA